MFTDNVSSGRKIQPLESSTYNKYGTLVESPLYKLDIVLRFLPEAYKESSLYQE